MKINKFAIAATMLIVALLMFGCAPAEIDDAGLVEEEKPLAKEPKDALVEPKEQTTPAPAKQSNEITQESMDKLDLTFSAGFEMAVSEGSKKMSFGDTHVFAVGIGNVNYNLDNFLLEAELRRSYDKMGNKIVEEESITPWIESNNFQIFSLERNQQIVRPFIVSIKNLADGTKPKAGTYEFELTIWRQGSRSAPVNKHASKTIAIQVE